MADCNTTLANHLAPPSPTSLVLLNLPISTKLTRSNYLAWQCQITPLFHGYGLFRFIDLQPPPPSQTITNATGQLEVNPEYLTWHKQDQILLGWLRSSLSESLLGQISFASTSAILWDYLQKSFSAVSRAHLSALLHQLRTTSKEGLSCSDYIQQMRSIADELSFIGAPVSDEDLMRYILEGLGSEFNPIVVTTNARSEPFSFTDLMSLILSHESLLQSQIAALTPATNNPVGFYSNPISTPPLQPASSFQPAPQFHHPRPAYRPNFRPRAPRPQTLVFNPPPNYFLPSQNSGPPLLPTPSPKPINNQWIPNRPAYPTNTTSTTDTGSRPVKSCEICSLRGHTADECWHRYDYRYGPSSTPSPQLTSPPYQAHVALLHPHLQLQPGL